MNYISFKEELKEVTRSTFLGCKERIEIKEIVGFGLYSDESAMTISASCNTVENLVELQEDEPGHDAYFRWTMGEWKYEMINQKKFAPLVVQLQNEHEAIGDNLSAFIQYRNKIYEIAVEVLEELRNESLFDGVIQNFVLMFGVSDFDDKLAEKKFVKRLNSKELFTEFISWIDSEEN